VKLYYKPGACSLSPHIALREAGLAFELERVNTKAGMTASGRDFAPLNPKGYVPVLELDDGTLLTEGSVIVQYVADLKPEAKLAPPPGSLERYRLQEWLNYVATELHKSFSSLYNAGAPAEWKQVVREQIAAKFDYLSRQLEGRSWLLGEQFTVADAYLVTILTWCRSLEVDLARWPTLKDYLERGISRPAVQAAARAEGLLWADRPGP
jgi:glutathione S-transferase